MFRDGILVGSGTKTAGGSSSGGWNIGRLNGLTQFNIDGWLADLTVWNCFLGQNEATFLQKFSPTVLKPKQQVFCLPLNKSLLENRVGTPVTPGGSFIRRADLFTSLIPVSPKRRFHLLDAPAAGGTGGGLLYGQGELVRGSLQATRLAA